MNSDYANLTLLRPDPSPACLTWASLAIDPGSLPAAVI